MNLKAVGWRTLEVKKTSPFITKGAVFCEAKRFISCWTVLSFFQIVCSHFLRHYLVFRIQRHAIQEPAHGLSRRVVTLYQRDTQSLNFHFYFNVTFAANFRIDHQDLEMNPTHLGVASSAGNGNSPALNWLISCLKAWAWPVSKNFQRINDSSL